MNILYGCRLTVLSDVNREMFHFLQRPDGLLFQSMSFIFHGIGLKALLRINRYPQVTPGRGH
ncbi:MAG: hypothetical protein KGL63_09270 [Betaproteobacteria bacterium]|nr:hypothetical protein [Betaproteobacteria bacterium]